MASQGFRESPSGAAIEGSLGFPARLTGGAAEKFGGFGLAEPSTFRFSGSGGNEAGSWAACRKADILASKAGVVERLGVRE